MDLKELSQLYYINKEIKRDRERLQQLRDTQFSISGNSDGMPRGTKMIYDPIAESIANIVDLEEMLKINIKKRYYEEKKIMVYINSIDDCFTRLIFKMRFVDCKPWYTIANEVGGGNTTDTVSKCCYRYLSKKPKKSSKMSD